MDQHQTRILYRTQRPRASPRPEFSPARTWLPRQPGHQVCLGAQNQPQTDRSDVLKLCFASDQRARRLYLSRRISVLVPPNLKTKATKRHLKVPTEHKCRLKQYKNAKIADFRYFLEGWELNDLSQLDTDVSKF